MLGSVSCLFAGGSLLFHCSLGCYSLFMQTTGQDFCGEPDIDG
jgi:hypothetical protein